MFALKPYISYNARVAKLYWHNIDIETQDYENINFWYDLQTGVWNQNTVVLIGSNNDPDFARNDQINIYLVSPVSCFRDLPTHQFLLVIFTGDTKGAA